MIHIPVLKGVNEGVRKCRKILRKTRRIFLNFPVFVLCVFLNKMINAIFGEYISSVKC